MSPVGKMCELNIVIDKDKDTNRQFICWLRSIEQSKFKGFTVKLGLQWDRARRLTSE